MLQIRLKEEKKDKKSNYILFKGTVGVISSDSVYKVTNSQGYPLKLCLVGNERDIHDFSKKEACFSFSCGFSLSKTGGFLDT